MSLLHGSRSVSLETLGLKTKLSSSSTLKGDWYRRPRDTPVDGPRETLPLAGGGERKRREEKEIRWERRNMIISHGHRLEQTQMLCSLIRGGGSRHR